MARVIAHVALALALCVLGADAAAVDLTSKTFDKEVFDSGKSAFVKFFAPWCARAPRLSRRDRRIDRPSPSRRVAPGALLGHRIRGARRDLRASAARSSSRHRVDDAASRRRGRRSGVAIAREISDSIRRGDATRLFASGIASFDRIASIERTNPPPEDSTSRLTTSQKTALPSLPSAPYRCGHCKALKPAWDKLGDEHKSSKTVVIADVDCTKEQDLCQKYGVSGYPTLKYFTGATAATGDAYNGGRDFDTLSAWAKDNLGPSCGAENVDLCDDDQKAAIKAKMAMSEADLDKEVEGFETEMKTAETELEELLKSLQAQYEAGKQKKDDVTADVSPKLAMLRSVKRAKAAGKTEL